MYGEDVSDLAIFGKAQDNDDVRHEQNSDFSEPDDDDEGGEEDAGLVPPGPPRDVVPRSNNSNTGPKGVIQDHKEFKERNRLLAEARKREREDEIRRAARGAGGKGAQAKGEQEEEGSDEGDEKEEGSDEGDELDAEFLAKYRAQRIKDMQKYQGPRFGCLLTISRQEYVEAVENVPDHVFVLVHLTQEYLPPCQRMTRCLMEIAKEFSYLKICEIDSKKAKPDYDDVALPTLIVYQKGEVVTTFVRATEELGFAFETPDVIQLLTRAGVISD